MQTDQGEEQTAPSNVDAVQTKKKTSEWLRTLEAESWQAELLISGLVIAGLLQLPDIFIHYTEAYLIESTPIGYSFLILGSLLLLIGIDCLIIFFGIHFLFRAIWIALLGLHSVYPDGVDENSTNSTAGAGPNFWKKAKEDYPDLATYNEQLDERCSLIFSMATVTIIMMTSFTFLIFIVYQIFRFLISIFPAFSDYALPIGIGLYLALTLSYYLMHFLAKKSENKERFEKMLERYNSINSNIFSLYIFKKPIGYITSILGSNNKFKYVGLVFFFFSFYAGYFAGNHTGDIPVFRVFSSDSYFTFNNKPYKSLRYNYDNLRKESSLIFTPLIPSDIVKGEKHLKVFIPTIHREKEQMGIEELSIFKKLKHGRAFRDSIHQADLAKHIDFNQIYVNEKPYSQLDFQYYTHPNADEEGVLTYIPTADFINGKNILEIRKDYFSKDGIQKIVKIPFYFEDKE